MLSACHHTLVVHDSVLALLGSFTFLKALAIGLAVDLAVDLALAVPILVGLVFVCCSIVWLVHAEVS